MDLFNTVEFGSVRRGDSVGRKPTAPVERQIEKFRCKKEKGIRKLSYCWKYLVWLFARTN